MKSFLDGSVYDPTFEQVFKKMEAQKPVHFTKKLSREYFFDECTGELWASTKIYDNGKIVKHVFEKVCN